MQSLGRFGMVQAARRKECILYWSCYIKRRRKAILSSTVEIIDYLAGKGFQIDRKTLRSDLRLLISMGYDIVVVKSSPNKYFWGERTFEMPELKMLLDAVSSARFISETKSKRLTKKIMSLAGMQQREQLKRHEACHR